MQFTTLSLNERGQNTTSAFICAGGEIVIAFVRYAKRSIQKINSYSIFKFGQNWIENYMRVLYFKLCRAPP